MREKWSKIMSKSLYIAELDPVDRLVGAVVHIGCLGVEGPGRGRRDGGVSGREQGGAGKKRGKGAGEVVVVGG